MTLRTFLAPLPGNKPVDRRVASDPKETMRPPEPQLAWLSEPLPGELGSPDLAPFRHLSERAPFPRADRAGGRYGPRIEVDLDSGPDAAAEARAAIGLLDGMADPDLLDDVRLLVSEVVTNAVRHAGAPADVKIRLTVSVADDIVRAEVRDGGRGFQPSPRDAPSTCHSRSSPFMRSRARSPPRPRSSDFSASVM